MSDPSEQHPAYGQETYGEVPYGHPSPYGQAPYGQAPYGQAPYGQAPYGQAPYGQAPYGQWPYGQVGYRPPYPPQAVDKHLGWLIVTWLFLWPLAIYSLVSAWQNIDRALWAGDLAGAQYQAGRVRTFGIVALCIGLAWIVLWFVLVVTVFTAVGSGGCAGSGC